MNGKKEIARITLSSLAPDSLAQLQTMARLGLRVEAIVAEGSPVVVFVPLVAPMETIEMRIDATDVRKVIDTAVKDMKAAQAAAEPVRVARKRKTSK